MGLFCINTTWTHVSSFLLSCLLPIMKKEAQTSFPSSISVAGDCDRCFAYALLPSLPSFTDKRTQVLESYTPCSMPPANGSCSWDWNPRVYPPSLLWLHYSCHSHGAPSSEHQVQTVLQGESWAFLNILSKLIPQRRCCWHQRLMLANVFRRDRSGHVSLPSAPELTTPHLSHSISHL